MFYWLLRDVIASGTIWICTPTTRRRRKFSEKQAKTSIFQSTERCKHWCLNMALQRGNTSDWPFWNDSPCTHSLTWGCETTQEGKGMTEVLVVLGNAIKSKISGRKNQMSYHFNQHYSQVTTMVALSAKPCAPFCEYQTVHFESLIITVWYSFLLPGSKVYIPIKPPLLKMFSALKLWIDPISGSFTCIKHSDIAWHCHAYKQKSQNDRDLDGFHDQSRADSKLRCENTVPRGETPAASSSTSDLTSLS